MNYNFNEVPVRRGTDSEKWETYDEDVLPMWVADMDFLSPPEVIQALEQRTKHGVYGYLTHTKYPNELRQAICNWLLERYNWQVQPDDLIFLHGVVIGFHIASYTLKAPKKGIFTQTPVYSWIWQAARNTRRLRQEMELSQNPDGSYAIDWDEFESGLTDKTGMFLLCNPHNPVGRSFRQDELERMAEACLRRGVTICSDEIHCDLVYPGQRHIPIASLSPEIARNTITLMSPSKTFNLAGLQFAFAIIQNPSPRSTGASMRRRYQRASQALVHQANVLSRTAALAAYRYGEKWLDELMGYLQANRDYLYDYVEDELPGISMARPEATYLAWLDCRGAGLPENPGKFFLDRARVALSDGADFGKGGEGFVRLNFGCPRSMLVEALERMKAVL